MKRATALDWSIHPELLVKSVMTAFLAIAATHAAIGAPSESSPPASEKCYGLVKAGMNDCATATASCAGSATTDIKRSDFDMKALLPDLGDVAIEIGAEASQPKP